MSINRRAWRWMSSLGAAVLLQCTSWHARSVTPATFVTEQRPAKVRIIRRTDGGEVVLERPIVIGDSIVGTGGSVAVSDAAFVAVARFNLVKTLGLVGGLWAGGGLICAATNCVRLQLGQSR